MKLHIRKTHTFLLLLGCVLLAVFRQPALFYPVLSMTWPAGGSAEYLQGGQETAAACASALERLRLQALRTCPDCALARAACVPRLGSQQNDWLSVVALDVPTARLRNGVAVFLDMTAEAGAAHCNQLLNQAEPWAAPVRCFPPGVPRPRAAAGWPATSALISAVATALGAFGMSWALCGLLIRYQHLHARFSLDATEGGPQKFHGTPTPRIGGVPIMAGLLLGATGLALVSVPGERGFYARLLLASLPAFAGGLIEDLTKQVGVTQRLLLSMAAGALASWIMGEAVLARLAIPGIDTLLKFYPLAVIVTMVAVAGLTNAFNIIDGYNGLASGTAVIVLAGLAGLALKVGDLLVLRAALVSGGAVLGFVLWNWPRGRIFLGDGGAYLLGFLLAELSVLLVVRNPSVSPWCALMLMAHPVTETLYSIYRRRVRRGHSAGHPDALHLHQLIYSRLVRFGVGSRDPAVKLARNSSVAPYFWLPAVLLAVLLQFCWDSSRYPVTLTLIYAASYVLFYERLSHWHAPSLLIRRRAATP